MLRKNGFYQCALCGRRLDLNDHTAPMVVIRTSFGKDDERVVTIDNAEIHRCRILRAAESAVRV